MSNVLIDFFCWIARAARALEREDETVQSVNDVVEGAKTAVDLAFPLGTVLYSFEYEDSTNKFILIQSNRVCSQYGHAEWISKSFAATLRPTPQAAIEVAVAHWLAEEPDCLDEGIEHFEDEKKYHAEHLRWAELALSHYKKAKERSA